MHPHSYVNVEYLEDNPVKLSSASYPNDEFPIDQNDQLIITTNSGVTTVTFTGDAFDGTAPQDDVRDAINAAGGTANIDCSSLVSGRIGLEGGDQTVTSITVTNVNIPDNLGFVSGAVTATRMKETIAIHEAAHALTNADFHGGHSPGDRCAGESPHGSQMLGWCPNHVKLLRGNIGRTYTTGHVLATDD